MYTIVVIKKGEGKCCLGGLCIETVCKLMIKHEESIEIS
jgi:hypothetical protein